MVRKAKQSYRDLVALLDNNGVSFELMPKGKAITFLEKNYLSSSTCLFVSSILASGHEMGF